jgi:uroporphyrin-3 C-methyltransferase
MPDYSSRREWLMSAQDSDTPISTDANVAAPTPKRSIGTFLSLASLLIALVAIVIAAWSNWQLLSLQALPARVSGDEGRLTELTRQLDLLAEDADKQQLLTEDIQASLEQGLSELAALPLRLEQVEQAVANIPGINPQSRSNWLKTEALYYMRIANAQALLAGDAQIAASALELADEKLREAGDPAMTKVRAQLSEEIAALKAIPEIDRIGISFRLASLSTLADSWPFRSAAPDNFSPEMDKPAEELGAWDRFIATIKAVLTSIVSIKETEGPRVTQLGVAEQALIVESVKAELQVARLSFVSGNTELFSQSLARTVMQVETYFDTEAAPVAAALATLTEIQAIEIPVGMPDISGSLSLMLAAARTDGVDIPGAER